MPDLKELFTEIKDTLSTARQESENLDRDEEKEMEYLKKGDRPHSVQMFSEEVDLAMDIALNLKTAEDDELEVEKIAKKGGNISKQLREKFVEDEEETEELVEHFLEEMRVLKQEAGELRKQVEENTDEQTRQEFQEDMDKLDRAIETAEEVKKEGKIIESRRSVMKKAGAVAAGATGGVIESQRSLVNAMVDQEEKRTEELGRSTDLNKKEDKKQNANVNTGNGIVDEKIRVGEKLLGEIEVIRTSSDTALAVVKMRNESDKPADLNMVLEATNWKVTGGINMNNGGKNFLNRRTSLKPGKSFAVGASFIKKGGGAGAVSIEIKSNSFDERIQLNFPASILEDHVVKNQGSIRELDLNYSVEQRNGVKVLDVQVKNTARTRMLTDVTFTTPSGWDVSGVSNAESGGAGMIATEGELGSGSKDSMKVRLDKQSSSASKVGALSVTAWPEDQPDNANYYLLPVDLQ